MWRGKGRGNNLCGVLYQPLRVANIAAANAIKTIVVAAYVMSVGGFSSPFIVVDDVTVTVVVVVTVVVTTLVVVVVVVNS